MLFPGDRVDGKTDNPFERAQKNLKRAIDLLNGKKSNGHHVFRRKDWVDRFVKRGLKRGHFWIWKENREICNDKNFVKVGDFEDPQVKLGFSIRSNKVKIKKFRKTLNNPIGFHEESFDDWILNKSVNGRLNNEGRLKRRHLVGDYDTQQKKWTERFVKRGVKRGHFWIWKENREVLDDKNFLEVKDFENPKGKVGFNIRSKNVELKWHWKTPKDPIRIHEESLEEWLLKKAISHGERVLEEVG